MTKRKGYSLEVSSKMIKFEIDLDLLESGR